MQQQIRFVRAPERGGLRREMAADVRTGLGSTPKTLPSKYFYDERGSTLFERITELPEYYPTRSETALLERWAAEIVARVRPQEIVEIGAGSSRKNRLLLEALRETGGATYAPIDVSPEALRTAADELARHCPWVEFRGIVGDFERDLFHIPRRGRRLVCFLGSTIGNLEPAERIRFLRKVREMLRPEEAFLLGIDLVKSRDRLERAYNDSQGVTAEFNLNILRVLNRELGGDIPLDAFNHHAFYEREAERIEMHLVCNCEVRARFDSLDMEVAFQSGESIRTEISCKFRRERVERELELSGLGLENWIVDAREDFALALARPRRTLAAEARASAPFPVHRSTDPG